MKKTVLVALLAAASVMPVAPVLAAPAAVKTAVPTECFFLPLLPDCITAWKAENTKITAATTKTAAVVVKPAAVSLPMLWTCKPAAATAGHLYDCSK